MGYRSTVGAGFNPIKAPTQRVALDPTHPLAQGLVGFWPLSSGAYDLSVFANNGSLNGAPPFRASQFGASVNLDGSSQSVTIPTSPSLNVASGGSVTMSVWVNPPSLPGAFTSIIDKRGASSPLNYGINFGGSTFQVYTDGGSGVQGFTYTLPTNKWTHVVGVISASAATALYIDGTLFGTSGTGGGVSSSANSLFIGGNNVSAEWFVGQIAATSVYNRALSAAEVAQIHASPFAMIRPVGIRQYFAAPPIGTTLTGSAYGRISSRTLIGWTAALPASASARMAARGAIGKAATATPSIAARASTRLAAGFTGTAQPNVNVRLTTRLAAGYSATLAVSADTRISYRISSGYSAVLPGNVTGSAWPRIATRASSGFLASLTASSTVREAFSAHSGYTATINIGSLPRASTRAVAGASASLFTSGVVRTSIHLGLNEFYTKIVVTYGVSAYARTRGVSAVGVTRGASAGQRTRGVTAWQR